MNASTIIRNVHLMQRAGFGPKAEDIPGLSTARAEDIFRQMLKKTAHRPEMIRVSSGSIDGLYKGIMTEGRMQELTKEQKQAFRKQSRESLKDLNLRWLDEMVHSDAQLLEKTALFWHGHFACREINIFFQQQLLDIVRTNALGNFGDLLREVSKSAAMLSFLNNQQNRKRQPNENFAREVMELFTMGRGHYTEKDIKEAARAFTGWGFDAGGGFVFRKQFHDEGQKTILGKTGFFTGDDVVDILLQQPQTALYITGKIYRYFVNDTPDEAIVQHLANGFFQSGYDIKKLITDIFLSPRFFDEKNRGVVIKSPVQLLAGIRRLLPMKFNNDEVQLLYQHLLGQVLFYPPNVAGWPGGKNWIDSSSLMYRLRLPGLLHEDESLSAKPKLDDDVMMGSEDKPMAMRGVIHVDIEWPVYLSAFSKTGKEDLLSHMAACILPHGTINMELMKAFINNSSRDNYIQSVTIQLMSLPEYQLM